MLKVNATADGYDFGRAGMKRLIGDGLQALPSTLVGTTANSAGTAGDYGSWVQMSADLGADAYVFGVQLITQEGQSVGRIVQAALGLGTSGSEVEKAAPKFGASNSTTAHNTEPIPPAMLPSPVYVASGTRVAVKVRDNIGATRSHSLSLFYAFASDLEDF